MPSEHLKRQMLGKKQVSPALTRLAVGRVSELDEDMALTVRAFNICRELGLLAAQKGALVFSAACCAAPSGVGLPRAF
jgi:hypothetical protein